MIYNIPIADVLHQETLLCDDFNSSFEGWVIVDNEDEKSIYKWKLVANGLRITSLYQP